MRNFLKISSEKMHFSKRLFGRWLEKGIREENEMTDTTEGQEQQGETPPEPTPAEVQATRAGWRPKDEWDDNGSAEWMDAPQFNERNERLANRGDKILKAEIASLNRKVQSMGQTITDAAGYMKNADARAYKKAVRDLEAKADKAVEEGDTDAYRAAKGEMKDLEQEVKAEATTAKKAAPTPDDDPHFQGWLPDNAWYDPRDDGFDAELSSFADSIAQQIGRTGLVGKPFYDRIAKEVKNKFPDRFGNQRRRQAQAVETGSGGGGGNGKSLWDDVPKDARAVFKRNVADGLFEDNKAGREKYADVYING